MALSQAQALTIQFYEWEQLGRGWFKAEYLADLEPPFRPFFGHFVDEPIIDDGRKETWLSELAAMFRPMPVQAVRPQEDDTLRAFPYAADEVLLTTFCVTLPRHFKQSAERMEQLLVMLSYLKSPLSFEIIASAETIVLQWLCKDYDAPFFQAQCGAFFPDCALIETYDDVVLDILEAELPLYTVDFGLSEECMRPLASHASLEADPYTALFGIFARLSSDEQVMVQILFSGVHNAWGESMLRAVCDDSGKQSFFIDAPEMPQLAKEKVSRPLYGVTIRALTCAETLEEAGLLLNHVATALVHASTGSANALMPLSDSRYTIEERLHDIALRVSHRVGMLLNSRELATMLHFPSPALHTFKLMGRAQTTKAAPASLINEPYCLGMNEHRHIAQPVGIAMAQRLRHIHILGATGTGKSTLLKSLIMQDILSGQGLMCLDPHGDLIDDIVRHIPEQRIKDVILIDPGDSGFPVGFNILVAHSDIEKELLASDLVAVFRRFSTSWGDQMNSVLANAILAFVYNTNTYHLGDLRKFLIETAFRTTVLATVTDPDITYYWQHEYPILKGSSIGSILTRLDAFLRPKVIRSMVCQKESLDFAQLMDSNKIVLVKLSQGLLGAENSYLLGAFIVSKLQQTAMARQAQHAAERIPFFCYIDEFHFFITPSMASILSGARKYGLGLVLSHQDMQQVAKSDTEIAGSVLANAGTRICFRLGDTDAKRLEDGFAAFTAEDLQNLSTGEAIARVNTNDADFNLAVMPYEPTTQTSFVQEIITHSRAQYSVPIPPQSVPHEAAAPIKMPPVVQEEEPMAALPKATATKTDTTETVREHRYLQIFIKAMAETQGYKASLEVPTPDGAGQVDIVLEKDGQAIAVEISVTTTPDWELHNIEKCLAAGYKKIVVCSNNAQKRKLIIQKMNGTLSPEQLARVVCIAPDQLQQLLTPAAPAQPTHTVMKGYRVKVQYEEGGSNKQDLLQSIIRAGRKP